MEKKDLVNTNTDIRLSINGDFFGIQYMVNSIDDEKEYIKFIKQIERMIRGSEEYRNFISYLKTELDINYCFILNTMTSENVKIEMHHYPYNLFSIVSIVINRFKSVKKSFNTFIISYIVMQLHYQNKIGLIPLSETMHQYIHSDTTDNIIIEKEHIIGNVKEFYNEYKDYMTTEEKLLYERYKDTRTIPEDQRTNSKFFSNSIRNNYISAIKSINVETNTSIEHKEIKQVE